MFKAVEVWAAESNKSPFFKADNAKFNIGGQSQGELQVGSEGATCGAAASFYAV